MKLKALTITMIMASFSAPIFASQESPIHSKQNTDPAAVAAYWTPERLRDAKPLDLPTVDPRKIERTSMETYLKNHPNEKFGDGEDGQPPQVDVKPNMNAIFKPILLSPEKAMTTLDAGTRQEHFSSTQLVPLSADLSYPYRAVGKLFFTIPGKGNYVCSAAVIKPRVVLTAGHCVHGGTGSSFYTNWVFIPAFRDGAAPYGTWNWSYVNVTNSWATGNGGVPNAGDYAMLEFKDQTISGATQKIGNVTGTLGYQLQSLMPNHLNLMGYPCNFDSCQKMHQVTAQSAAAASNNNVEYGSDMTGGSSGGPWVQNFGKYSVGQTGGNNAGINRVVGVTSWGYIDATLKGQGASIFNAEFTTLLNSLCAHQAGNC